MRSKLASIAQSVLGNVQDGSRDLEIRAWEGLRVSRSTREIIDYKGFAKKILKTYTLGGWNRYEITGNEVWRTWG
jgi:hypothetical protein